MATDLHTDIQYLKGIGPRKAEAFRKLGIRTSWDLLHYFPRNYEDRSLVKAISELEDGESVTVKGTVQTVHFRRFRKNLSALKVMIQDRNAYAQVTWFNQDYLRDTFKEGDIYWFYGKFVRKGIFFEVSNPSFSRDCDSFARIEPIYQKTAGITQSTLRRAVGMVLELHSEKLPDLFPEHFRREHGLADINDAIRNIHYPESNQDFFRARKRLVFEELFLMQLGLLFLKKRASGMQNGYPMKCFDKKNEYISELGFSLTTAQRRVLSEIEEDLRKPTPMNRLLQGDVGSGKTVVAACTVMDAFENGFQSALMAPTEILAKQHADTLADPMKPFGIRVAYLGGKLPVPERRDLLKKIKNGEISLVVGTHAIIQEEVEFSKLGLVITDEQHRFGVNHRSALVKKGQNPHVLVMTATPIPRTLALILYGDLDISVLDEMPPGKKPVETYVVGEEKRQRIYDFMEKHIVKGNQAYVVCPLIEDGEDTDLQSVEQVRNDLCRRFPNYHVGLVHGRMRSEDKDLAMGQFYQGTMNILVSTTVIEVGVHIPNATLMVVENAEQFGLAQLHQLRGRVGRGHEKSYCILIHGNGGELSQKRMKVMEQSNDGFYISEQDLKLRGPGDFFGTKQHGIPDMRIANLYRDLSILKTAQEAAFSILASDSDLSREEHATIRHRVRLLFQDQIAL